ncbi:MAG TPA: peptide ABC transporter substrate-binding protein [Aliidongia sp.]|nr:peptide ABC transporter substrate-binding protein [Aliidongia sp.]
MLLAGPALADPQILRRGNNAEPLTLDPQRAETASDVNLDQDLFEGLTILDRSSRPAPGVATQWTVSDDGLTYRFKLRPAARWSDGSPVTAEDFVWSWRRAVMPVNAAKLTYLFYPIAHAEAIATGKEPDPAALGVQAPDPQTLVVTLRAPAPYFSALVAAPTFMPVPRAAVEKAGALFTRPGNLVGNGAFKLAEWTPQSRIILARNPNYWDAAKVALDEVIYYPVEDQKEELKRYRAGELDVTCDLPTDQIDFIRTTMAGEVRISPYFGLSFLGFNLTRPPFKDNLKLRQAIDMAIDREMLAAKIVRTGETPTYVWVPPGIPGYASPDVPWKSQPIADRIATAKRLLAEAGYGPGHPLKVELRYNTSENNRRTMLAIAGMLKQALDIEVDLVNEEFKTLIQERKLLQVTQMFRSGMVGEYYDPEPFLESMLPSSGNAQGTGYDDPDYENLVKQASITADPAERMKLLASAEAKLLADVPAIPLYNHVNKQMVKPYVRGFEPNLFGIVHSKDVSLVRTTE